MIAIYARQSIEKKDSLSIDSQIEKCKALCTMNGWEEYKIFKDPGFSGKNLDRPGFTEMLKEIRSGSVEYVLCYRLDRISRSMRDFVNLVADFETYNTMFASVTESIDTSSSAGRMLMTVIMAMAQMERENIVERVTDNYYYRCNLGFWGGGPAPYGYSLARTSSAGKQHTTLEIDKEEAAIVRNIFNWYLEPGGSVRNIIAKLNTELKIKTRRGSQWTSRVVSDLLWKPLYTSNSITIYNYFKTLNANILNAPSEFDGDKAVNLYGKANKNSNKHKRCREIQDLYFIVSQHQPIIEDKIWIAVQLKKNNSKLTPPRAGTGKNSYFTGMLKCKECGRGVSILKDGKSSGYYVCSARKNLGKGACLLPLLPQRKIDPIIIEDLINHFSKEYVEENLINAKFEQRVSSEYVIKNNMLEMELAEIEKEIENLINAIASGNNTVSKYVNSRITALDNRKIAINKEMHRLQLKEYGDKITIDYTELIDIINNIESTLESNDFDSIQKMSKALIKTITFDKDKNIEIDYLI